MTKNEKAVAQLGNCGIEATIENDTVYVVVDDTQLELAEFEINFRAKCYDEEEEDNK